MVVLEVVETLLFQRILQSLRFAAAELLPNLDHPARRTDLRTILICHCFVVGTNPSPVIHVFAVCVCVCVCVCMCMHVRACGMCGVCVCTCV